MQILAIANQKGGVGKSTLAVHLVWLAQEHGRPVVLLDLDGQANSTRTFLPIAPAEGITASSLFAEIPDARALMQIAPSTWIIPADLDVNDLEALSLDSVTRPLDHLNALGAELPVETLVVIDTPPTLGRRLIAALIAATAVISPLAPNGYALQGITDLQETILMVQGEFNPRLANLGLLPNMVNARSSSHARMLRELNAAIGNKVLDVSIGQRVAIADAVDEGRPVWRATKGESALLAGREMRSACEWILARVSAR